MSGLLAIDSGVKPACAYFEGACLISAEFTLRPGGAGLRYVVVERPHYRGAADAAVVGALFKMACGGYLAAGHALCGAGAKCELIEFTPADWKEQEQKPVNHARLWSVLTDRERKVLGGGETQYQIQKACEKGADARWRGEKQEWYPDSFKTHNLLDAAAIGCFFLGRLQKPSRVRPSAAARGRV